ncbi:hypothetical protein ERJ75_001019400 [Trypanosoma vivax]|nr:hypothetical protein ERJ75_001019400 [Trypanosoma vivax]
MDESKEVCTPSNEASRGVTSFAKSSPFMRLPRDVLQLVLMFIPPTAVLREVSRVARSLASIAQSEMYWESAWELYIASCCSKCVQQATLKLHDAFEVSTPTSRDCSPQRLLLASVPRPTVPGIFIPHVSDGNGLTGYLGRNVKIVEKPVNGEPKEGNNTLMHIELLFEPVVYHDCRVDASPLRRQGSLLSLLDGNSVEGGFALTRRGASPLHKAAGETLSHGQQSGMLHATLMRRALFFLYSHVGNSGRGGIRPMIDSFSALRLSVFSHKFPSTYRREGTALERETALVELVNALIYALDCCIRYQGLLAAPGGHGGWETLQMPIVQQEGGTGFIFTPGSGNGGADAGEGILYNSPAENMRVVLETVELTGGLHNGIFFSTSDSAFRQRAVAHKLRYGSTQMQIYLFMISHISFSDVHVHISDGERKSAICSRLLSPTGQAVEFRFFYTLWLDSYPRFFVKMVFAEADLPRTRIQEVFDHSCTHPSSAEGDGGGGDMPALHSLFYGGFGRVEVDIRPVISSEGFHQLRAALGLSDNSLPMPLLWNIVMLATGVGGVVLRDQQNYFILYYDTTFAAEFYKACSPTLSEL